MIHRQYHTHMLHGGILGLGEVCGRGVAVSKGARTDLRQPIDLSGQRCWKLFTKANVVKCKPYVYKKPRSSSNSIFNYEARLEFSSTYFLNKKFKYYDTTLGQNLALTYISTHFKRPHIPNNTAYMAQKRHIAVLKKAYRRWNPEKRRGLPGRQSRFGSK